MILKMFVKDYKRKKVITIVLFAFMLLAATLAAAGSSMFLSLTGAMDSMFRAANTPHYLQFHIGPYDEDFVRQWTQDNPTVKEWSIAEALHPREANLYLNGSAEALDVRGSWFTFITQNEDIDIILTIENKPIDVQDGHIAVPIIFSQWADMEIGDRLTVSFEGYEKIFTISGFLRDSIFGGEMMTAKRFVLSDNDQTEIKNAGADVHTLFSFVLNDEALLGGFLREYRSSDMPQSGVTVDIALVRMVYSVTSGVILGLVLLCSLLLVLIAFLTLRYTILSAIEEDFREIGVMKAIGFKPVGIIRLYMSKYILLSSAACIAGSGLGQLLLQILNTNILLFLGAPDNGMAGILASVGSVILILVSILLFCLLTLRRIGKMTVIDAMRAGNIGETYSERKWLTLSRRRLVNVNIFIGLKEVLIQLRVYVLLFIVYLLCAFICIFPINLKNSFSTPESMRFTGSPISDIKGSILGGAETTVEELEKMLAEDADVTKWAVYSLEQYGVIHEDGMMQNFDTIVGGQTLFYPHYTAGTPPVLPNEIALSFLLAQDLRKNVGDSILLYIDGEKRHMLISGIYPHTDDGGRSMRSCLEQNASNTRFWSFHINVNGDAAEKVLEYRDQISGAAFFTLQETFENDMSETASQIEMISILLAVIAILVTALITALFVKMLMAKETSQIAVMKSIGFAQKHISAQYITRVGLVLLVGIVMGMLTANIGGEKIMSAVFATMGAPIVKLVIRPVEVYAILPLILLVVVYITALLGCRAIRKISISQINAE